MPWLLVGYMFLFVHRPFEVWPVLGDLRVERIYMLVMIVAWTVAAPALDPASGKKCHATAW